MQCENYNHSQQKADFSEVFRRGDDGRCKRKVTREVAFKNGVKKFFCGHCARKYRIGALVSSVSKINRKPDLRSLE